MNDQPLGDRLRSGVSGIEVRPRLDEVLGSADPGLPGAGDRARRAPILAVAAVVLAVAAVAGVIVASVRTDDPTGLTDHRPTTTTIADVLVGERLAVPAPILPPGFALLEEGEHQVTVGQDVIDGVVVARFGDPATDGDPAAPQLRLAYFPATVLVQSFRMDVELEIGTRPDPGEVRDLDAYDLADAYWAQLPPVIGAWQTVGVSRSPHELVLVQGRGIGIEQLRALVAAAIVRT